MEWYWWVLIAVGAVAIGIVKIKVWNSMMKKRKEKKERMEQEE